MSRSHSRHRRGMSLIEVLVAITISSALLVAMCTAFTTTAQAVETNDQFFRATQAARVTTNITATEIRRCQSVVGVSDTWMRLICEDGQDKTWQYVPATGGQKGKIQLINNTLGTTSTLTSNVKSAKFTAETGKNANNTTCIVKIAMNITVEVGDSSTTIPGSAVPRANMQY